MTQDATGSEAQPSKPGSDPLDQARQQAKDHADDPETGQCRHCGESRCQVWRAADRIILRSLDGMATDDPEVD